MGGGPPQSRGNPPPDFSLPSEPHPNGSRRAWTSARDQVFAFSLTFTCLFVSHATLLRLPYFWDEAGYFVPAARDLMLTGSLIPHSTLSNAHPPLVMLWLAFWWKYSAFTPATTRTAMLLVASFALLGVWRLARRAANNQVAIATVVCTAVYPVFFAQSSLAHLDTMACALTIWGLAMYVEQRRVATIVFFALAPLTKETAIIAPIILFGWELLCPRFDDIEVEGESLCWQKRDWFQTSSLLLCVVPLALWLIYHHHKTGYFLGNPQYLRYNLGATLTPLRIALAMLIRLWHLLGYLNLFVLTLLSLYALSQPPLLERDGSDRQPIAIPVQCVFIVVIAAYVVALSVLGGAVLARYMLPVMPLVILLCVSTLRRRLRYWVWWVGAVCVAFVFALLTPPPYRIAPEDTLLYRDYVILHKQAATEIAQRYPHARILTAWPASDELTKPFLGYVKQPADVIQIDNFSQSEMERAAQAASEFDVAFLFTTRWQPPHPLWQTLPFGEAIQERFFDYHEDISPDHAASMLGGRVVRYENRNDEWVAIISIEHVENAEAGFEFPVSSFEQR
jgi:hypothetical protein